MPDLVAAAYLAPSLRRAPDSAVQLAQDFHASCSIGLFPYDVGDDPSFFSSNALGGPVTWGVCRPDARGAVKPGDWVAFFSAERVRGQSGTDYSFVAALRVSYLTSQKALWSSSSLPCLRQYLNLLIAPEGDGWRHYEPALHKDEWHEDWIWRLCNRRGLRKAEVGALQHQSGEEIMRNGIPLPVANNYVVFDVASKLRSDLPIPVATHPGGRGHEIWLDTPIAQAIRESIFGNSPRALRTTNPQRPHRHFRRPLIDSIAWMKKMNLLISDEEAKRNLKGSQLKGLGRFSN